MKYQSKRRLRNLLILIFPFLFMVIVNEIMRPHIKGKPYSMLGVTAMNSDERMKEKCSWACHNDTNFCQENHTCFMRSYFPKTDSLYYGAIGLLMSTGAYGPANLIVFVFLLPLIIWLFITGGLRASDKIKDLKNQK